MVFVAVPRDRANIRTDIWADGDWRELRDVDQHLYLLILTHATLNYAGVADWRPGRLAALFSNGSVDVVRERARCLEVKGYILVDDETEEVLIRSFVKHDGLMKQPKLAVAMANAFAAIASTSIRQVVAFEIQKLHERMPELSAWGAAQVRTVLSAKASPISAFTPAVTPPLTPVLRGTADQAQGVPTTTATTTATSTEVDGGTRKRATRIPENFEATDDMRTWAALNTPLVNIDRSTARFINYWTAKSGKDATKLDWKRTWQNWLLSDQEKAEKTSRKPTPTERAMQTAQAGRQVAGRLVTSLDPKELT